VRMGSALATSGASAAAVYDYVNSTPTSAVPAVTSVSPGAGQRGGGGIVTIFGSGFASGASVTFGSVRAAAVDVVSPTELRVHVPPEATSTKCATGARFNPSSLCQVEVVVTEPSGKSAHSVIHPALSGPLVYDPDGIVAARPGTEVTTASTEYDYAARPVITQISPAVIPAGGAPVTITGSGFSYNTLDWVNFGPAASVASEQTAVTFVSATKIVIRAPGIRVSHLVGLRLLAGGVSVQATAGLSNASALTYAGQR
jgi:large repetitive protein